MDYLLGVDLRALFVPQVSIVELFIRGSSMYLGLFTLLRVVLKRESGGVSVTDLLVVVLLADAAQNGLAGGYETITEGLILVAIIVGWSYILNWLGYHFKPAERFVFPKPLLLVEDGHIQWENMRRELITQEELESQLRQQGVDDLSHVKAAYMEGKGQISVIKKEQDDDTRPQQQSGVP